MNDTVSTAHPTFEVCCDRWLARQKGNIRPASYASYLSHLEKHIKPFLGKIPVDELTSGRVDAFKQHMSSDKGLSPKTVNGSLMVVNTVLRFTARQFPDLPRVDIPYVKREKKDAPVLSGRELRLLSSCLLQDMDDCKFGILLAMITGLRVSELCALRWQDISLPEGTLRVSSILHRVPDTEDGGTKVVLETPSNEAGIRTIPLSQSICRLCGKMGHKPPAAFVLTGSADFMEPRKAQRRLERYCQDCGLKGVQFTTLRNTFIAQCMENDFETGGLIEILGNRRVTETVERFANPSAKRKRSDMEKLSTAVDVNSTRGSAH